MHLQSRFWIILPIILLVCMRALLSIIMTVLTCFPYDEYFNKKVDEEANNMIDKERIKCTNLKSKMATRIVSSLLNQF